MPWSGFTQLRRAAPWNSLGLQFDYTLFFFMLARFFGSAVFAGLLSLVGPAVGFAATPVDQRSGGKSAVADVTGSAVEPGKKFVYKQSGDKPQELEVYFPPAWQSSGPPVPGVILFHGGSWTAGNLVQLRYACKYLASRGVVAATANYRMYTKPERESLSVGESYKRVCIIDAKSAIRWMKQHAEELGIDPRRLVTGGGSAGGQVAVLATLNQDLNDPDDPKGFDTSVAAYLLFNPAFTAEDSADAEVDVLQHVAADMAPAIFFFGTEDREWQPGSIALLQKLKLVGGRSDELWLGEGQKHGFFNRSPWRELTLAEADRFLVRRGLLSGSGSLPRPSGGEKLVRGQ
jgi:acetyl esterase